jgi:hypothetical protein
MLAALAAALLAGTVRADDTPTQGGHREYALVPLVGGDTDTGFGGGALGSLAQVDPAFRPFRWKLETATFITFRHGEGGFSSPYQDLFALLTINGLLGGRGRLELRPSYTRKTNLRYAGIGNASVATADDNGDRQFFTRVHPALLVRFRLALAPPFYLLLGTLYTHNWISYEPDSTLAQDLASPDPRVRDLLLVDRRHGLHLLEAGIIVDTRDDEVASRRGQYHTLKARVSPWSNSALPYRYVQIDLATRFYATVWPERLVLGARLVGDVQIGSVPFYELSRYDEASALGGANSVRGVPADRYRGKRKVFANFEARGILAHFTVRGSPYALGLTGFVDTGRVWADLTSAPELDGTGLGLKYGVGGGLRLHKGRSFVLRFDLAWSPDASPLAGYLLAGQMF